VKSQKHQIINYDERWVSRSQKRKQNNDGNGWQVNVTKLETIGKWQWSRATGPHE